MERKSEYFSSLSASAKDRYEKKVMATGLKVDPYSIERWHEDSEVFPKVNWSDMLRQANTLAKLYRCYLFETINVLRVCCFNIGLERNARWWMLYESWMGP